MAPDAIPVDPESKYRLLLRLAKAANAQLEFFRVLEAICDALHPHVRVDLVGVAALIDDRLQPQELHVRGMPRPSRDAWPESLQRTVGKGHADVRQEMANLFAAPDSGFSWVARHRRMVHGDLTAGTRFPEDAVLRGYGVRSYVRTPLIVRDRLVGVLHLARADFVDPPNAPPFTAAEAEFVTELSDALASTIANSLAYEESVARQRRTAMENLVLREDLDAELMFGDLVGSSPPLRDVLAGVQKVAATDATVLITGETGTGKELVARAIQRGSRRARGPMIKVNCAALPESLVASELFGHEKGAFTGALQRRAGRFELASGGTIFLDEVGELALDVQAALLRVLQEGEFERVGGTQTLRTDVRVIAATNRDLHAEVARGRFRSDLFYRLSVFPLHVPPLRERRDDVPVLVEYFAAKHATRLGRRIRRIDKASMERLRAYDWPGNIRELQNVVERAMILADGDLLVVEATLLGTARTAAPAPAATTSGIKARLDDQEKAAIEAALAAAGGRIAGADGAAARLGMRPTTLQSKIARYGIDRHRFR